MKRIAINGSQPGRRSNLTKALSAMTGMDMVLNTPYQTIASQYQMAPDMSECIWPEAYIYCLEAFTRKIMFEQKYGDGFISDGGVFEEICWIKHLDSCIGSIYEMTVISSFEKVMMNYALNAYDYIFHIESGEPLDAINRVLKQLYRQHALKHHIIDESNDEKALHQMIAHLSKESV